MPILKNKQRRFAPDERVRAVQSFATANATIRSGAIFRGDDPIVREHHPWFEALDTPDAEAKNYMNELSEPPPDSSVPLSSLGTEIRIGASPLADVPAERLVRAIPVRSVAGQSGEVVQSDAASWSTSRTRS